MIPSKKILFIILFFLFILNLVGCGGGDSSTSGNSQSGEELFSQSIIGTQPGCIICHSLEPGVVIVGPALSGIASRAGSRVAGLSAEEYIRQSILEPDSYIVEGFQPGVMVQVWKDELTPEQVDNLVTYLLTLQ